MRRVEVLSALNLPVQRKATRTSDGIVSLAEGCVQQKHVSFRVLALTFHHQFSLVDLVASNQLPDVRLHQIAARKNCYCLDLVCFVVFQPVISSSQASSGASVCVVRSRNVLCGKRLTMVLETDGFCVRNAAQSFFRLGKRTQMLYSTPNKRSTLCDPDNNLSYERLHRSFLVLESIHVHGPRKTPDLQYQHHSPAAQCLEVRA